MAGPWEEYQAPPDIVVTVRPNTPQVGPWLDYAGAAQAPSVTEDVIKTVPAALARGAANLAGSPRDMADLGAAGVRKINPEVEALYRQIIKQTPMGPFFSAPSSQEIQGGIEQVTGPLHKPQTSVGQYVNAPLELAPAAVAGPGNFLRNLLAFAVVPGVAGEGAVDLTKTRGTELEPWVRGGAQLPAALTGAYALRQRGPKTIANNTQGVDLQAFQSAEQLFQEAMQAGVPITRAEALQHVTNGATRLADVQRVVEGQGRLKDFFAGRVQGNDAAFGRVVDQVQPQPTTAPSNIGPEVSQASQETITGVRKAINDASQPYYNAAAQDKLSPQVMAQVRAAPGYDEAVAAIRKDPQLARYVENLPEDSVAFINELKKYVDNQAKNAAGPMNAQRNQQRAAGYSKDAELFRDAGVKASTNYETALAIQEQGRKKYLEPLLSGPLGKLAKDDLTTRQAIEVLFPTNPVPNSAAEVTQAVTALAKKNPQAARDLVRAHLESVFNESTQRLQGGLNQFSGAGFAATVRGNPQQAANLEAAIRALPNGNNIWPGVNRFLEFLEAQGQRQRIGSQTAFNAEMLAELKGSNTLVDAATQGAKTGFLKLPARLEQVFERWRLGQNVDDLARLLTDPRAGAEFQRLARLPSGSNQVVSAMSRLIYMGQFAANKSQPQPAK
jgi:hypothetical protein